MVDSSEKIEEHINNAGHLECMGAVTELKSLT